MTRTPKDHGRQDDAGPASGGAGPAFVSRVREIEERLSKATPGPWYIERDPTIRTFWTNALPPDTPRIFAPRPPFALGGSVAASADPADADLIAHAPTDLRYLLNAHAALVEVVSSHLASLEALHGRYGGGPEGQAYMDKLRAALKLARGEQ